MQISLSGKKKFYNFDNVESIVDDYGQIGAGAGTGLKKC